MEIVICPACSVRVVPAASGECPSCGQCSESFQPVLPLEIARSQRGEASGYVDLGKDWSSEHSSKDQQSIGSNNVSVTAPLPAPSSLDFANLGGVLGGAIAGAAVIYFKLQDIQIPLGDLGVSLVVSMSSLLVAGIWAKLGLPKLFPRFSHS